MSFDFDALNVDALNAARNSRGKGRNKKINAGACVKSGTLNNMNREGSGGILTAQMFLTVAENKAQFRLYGGDVEIEVGEDKYVVHKAANENGAHIKHQEGDRAEGFLAAFKALAANPDTYQGTVKALGELPELPEAEAAE